MMEFSKPGASEDLKKKIIPDVLKVLNEFDPVS